MNIKQITIIRHGMPQAHHKYSKCKLLSGSAIAQFITDWNTCELSSENKIPENLKEQIAGADKFINSTLKRTKDSFGLLGIVKTDSIDALNEAELPNGFLNSIYLPMALWGIVIRLLWVMGYTKNSESYRVFKKRIKEACDYIVAESLTANHVVVMGHGLTNMQLKKELKKNSWKHVLSSGGYGYWSYDTFETEVTQCTFS